MYATLRQHLSFAATVLFILFSPPVVGQVINEDEKIIPSDGFQQDFFGESVSMSGNIAVLGARLDDTNGLDSGSAYLFHISTGQKSWKLLANDGASLDQFGQSVAVNGTTVVVGSPWDDDNGPESGSVYLFDSITGQQTAKLLPDDGSSNDFFGYSVAISETNIIVGGRSGSVYLFDSTTGQQLFKLLPTDGAEGNQFGEALAIHGNLAVVGAEFDDDNGTNSGAVYVFDASTGHQIMKIYPSDGASRDFFGRSVAINSSYIVVGAPGDDDNGSGSGSAYLFNATTLQQVSKLLPVDGMVGDRFGESISISGNRVVIGARTRDESDIDSGAAFVFDTTTGKQIAMLLPSDGAERDEFGTSVGVSGNKIVVGASEDDDNGFASGSGYIFSIPSLCPPDLNNDGSLNFFDVSAYLTAYATNDPAADFNNDGEFNFFDVSAFLVAYLAGCP